MEQMSIEIIREEVRKHDGKAFNINDKRVYLKAFSKETNLSIDYLKAVSKSSTGVMIDFNGSIEPFHVEVEVYLWEGNTLFSNEFFTWSDTPCSVELSKDKYYEFRQELVSLSQNSKTVN